MELVSAGASRLRVSIAGVSGPSDYEVRGEGCSPLLNALSMPK